MNQSVASDPESSWQVRLKGKTLKALMGASAAYAGDHVELSDRGDDFASTVGIGAVVSTKFTWPADPRPENGLLLTPAKETEWRRWIALYKEKRLPEGGYRGELYDIAFDRPEAHVVEKDGQLYYAFYADRWDGPIELRGLGRGRYSRRRLRQRQTARHSCRELESAPGFLHAVPAARGDAGGAGAAIADCPASNFDIVNPDYVIPCDRSG